MGTEQGVGTYYHYTSKEALKKIAEDGKIRQSIKESKNDDARFGNGTYLTTIGPDASRDDVARNNYDGRTSRFWESNRDKVEGIVQLSLPKSMVQDHSSQGRDIHKVEGDIDLKDSKNVKFYIRDGKGNLQTYEKK